MNSPIRTLIVDEDDLSRQATRTLLEGADGITTVGETQNVQEGIELIHELEPDVVLLSVDTLCPDALRTVALISELYPHSKMIVLSAYDGQEHLVLDAFRQGVMGYLVKGKSQPFEIVEAIRTVGRGGAILSPCVAGHILDEMIQRWQHRMATGESDQ